MIPIKQAAAVLLLGGGAVTVWVPDVRNAISGKSTETTQGAEGVTLPIADGSKPAIEVSVSAPPAVPQVVASEPAAAGIPGGLAPSIEPGIESGEDPALRNFGSRGRSFLLMNPTSKYEEGTEAASAPPQIQLWLIENPLTGIMRSPKGNRAIFGGSFFSEGQALLDGWELQTIHPEFVEVQGKGGTRKVRLPRLGDGLERQPQSESSVSSNSGQSSAPAQSNEIQSENF
ncbi:MAG: hypothetical protein P1V35_08695 [Planctomycetota bacterium]|nr:hypothetical protein [Planctomycetota bacterium]